MENLIVKNVDMFGDSVMAAQDNNGNIWAGVSYFCRALGMNKGQKDRQVTNIGRDKTLSKGCCKFAAGIFDSGSETLALRFDFIPLWLAKITITDTMQKDHPDLADKLLQYQLKAKDILADAFLPKHETGEMVVSPSEIPLGEVASYLKIMDRVANRQNLAPHRIAANFKKVSEQFGIQLSDDFVNVPEYEQLTLASVLKN